MAPVLKTGDPKGSVGSNPTPSVDKEAPANPPVKGLKLLVCSICAVPYALIDNLVRMGLISSLSSCLHAQGPSLPLKQRVPRLIKNPTR
jgi:hypothetical protein